MDVLKVSGLAKNFGGIVACSDLSFSVETNKILGIIGPNGAGKTTVFNLITGVYSPTRGQIIFQGEGITGQAPDRIVRKGIARTFQNIRLFRNLTVLENVVIALDQKQIHYSLPQAVLHLWNVARCEQQLKELALDYLGAVGLKEKAAQRADSLPYGLQRKLEVARALALRPTVLLLDEPAAGMNPEEAAALTELIREIRDQYHLTILLIEHHMDVVMSLCDQIVVMNFGEKLAEGSPQEIQSNPAVLKAYLGEGYKHA
ncbi:MAG: ABC transporter ATP-binding protein [Bacillota bacterium]